MSLSNEIKILSNLVAGKSVKAINGAKQLRDKIAKNIKQVETNLEDVFAMKPGYCRVGDLMDAGNTVVFVLEGVYLRSMGPLNEYEEFVIDAINKAIGSKMVNSATLKGKNNDLYVTLA